MKKSVYSRPNKPMSIPVRRRHSVEIKPQAIQEPVAVDRASECHVTPPDVARRMVSYLGSQGDYLTLEPSAGTGALVSALLASGHSSRAETCAVERHHTLAGAVRKLGVPVIQECFLEYAARVRGKVEFPRIIMNPLFSEVRKHVKAARSLLGRNGHVEQPVLGALVPVTFDHEAAEMMETLPEDTFSTCKVRAKIVRILGG